jgi:hypothetical protein
MTMRMLPRNVLRLRNFIRFAGVTFGWILSAVSVPALAQTAVSPDAPDTSAPPVVTTPTPALPATPQTQASAATPAPDSGLSPTNAGAFSTAAGPAPVSGPGSSPISDLGQNLNSAANSTKIPFHVTATLGEVYDNNIFNGPHKVSDFVTRVSVRGELQLGNLQETDGNYLDAVYVPTLHLYARHSHEDGVDENVDVLYAHHWTRLTLSLEQLYLDTQTTNASIGGLVTTTDYSTTMKADFAYSTKLDLAAILKQEFISYNESAYTDTREWTGDVHALYHLDSKLSLGLGPRFGYLSIEDAPNQTYEQILARAVYVLSDKLTFRGEAGGEDRQYRSTLRSDTLTPIFYLSGIYLPFPSTKITANASRRFTPSYNFVGEDYLATNVYLTATQRFLNAYYVGLSAGYENDDYQLVASGDAGPTREDNYFYVQPSLRWSPNGWLQVSAFDRFEEDNSNFDAFAYDTNQVGVSCSATY